MTNLRQIWRALNVPHGAVWLPVWPPFGAFIELAALICAIYFLDLLLPGVDVANLEPSPYWIPVLLLSLQYGTVGGLMAAGAATLVYALGGLPEQAIEENHFTYLLRVWAMPILWIGVGLVLGQFRLRQIEIKQRIKDRLAETTAESEGLGRYAKTLEERCRELERRITTGASGNSAAMLDALQSFLDPASTLSEALTASVREGFPGAAVAAYLLTPWGLEPTIVAGEASAHKGDHVIKNDSPLFAAIATDRRLVSVAQKGDENTLQGEGLAAVPVFQQETGRVIGMLKLEAATGDVLDGRTAARLALLARFVAPLLSEPRVIVDNTERQGPANDDAQKRLTRGWRQYSWQQQHGPEAGAAEQGESDGSGRVSRPRVSK